MATAKKTPSKTVKMAAKKTATKTAVKKSAAKKTVKVAATHEEISKLAHKYYLERGGQHGSDADDWLRAEKELLGGN